MLHEPSLNRVLIKQGHCWSSDKNVAERLAGSSRGTSRISRESSGSVQPGPHPGSLSVNPRMWDPRPTKGLERLWDGGATGPDPRGDQRTTVFVIRCP